MKVKKIFILIFLIIYIIPCTSMAFDYKLEDEPSYWEGNNWPMDLFDIVMTPNGNALFNSTSKKFSDVNTSSNFTSTTSECILWINKYTHGDIDYKTVFQFAETNGDNPIYENYNGINEDLYNLINTAFNRYFSKDEIKEINNDIKGNYNEEKDSNKYDTDSGDGKGVDENTSLYYAIISKNYSETVIESIDTMQELTASAGYYKGQGSNVKITTKFEATDGKYIDFIDDYDTKLNYSEAQIKKYLKEYGVRCGTTNNEDRSRLINNWASKIKKDGWVKTTEEAENIISTLSEEMKIERLEEMTGYTKEELDEMSEENKKLVKNIDSSADIDADTVFLQPTGSGNNSNGVQDAINDAETFVTTGDQGIISEGNLQEFSQNLYSILLSIGVVVAVLIGAILGVKLMLAPISERAEAKKLLIPYVVGCIIVFGAFGIWKLVVTIMQGM